MDLLKESERLSRELGDIDALQCVLGNEQEILRRRGDLAGALVVLREGEHLCRALRNRPRLAAALADQACVLYACRDFGTARTRCQESLELFRPLQARDEIKKLEQLLTLIDVGEREFGPHDGDARVGLPLVEQEHQMPAARGFATLAQQVKRILRSIRAKLG
jgi:hypothetical protein